MKTLIKSVLIVVVFCLGLLAGYRLTVTHAQVEIVSPNRVELTVWGRTNRFFTPQLLCKLFWTPIQKTVKDRDRVCFGAQ